MASMTTEFADRLDAWLRGCQHLIDDHFALHFSNLTPTVLSIEPGQRYLRIVSTNDGGRGQRSAYAFIDTSNGDILRAESWKKPAKHARGNLFDAHNGLEKMSPYGPAYLR